MIRVVVRAIADGKTFWTGEAQKDVVVQVYGVSMEWMQWRDDDSLTITTSEECAVALNSTKDTLRLDPIPPRKEPCYTGYAGEGDWRVENMEEYNAKIRCSGWNICTLWGGIQHGGHAKAEILTANANLIKAAPRMHKALRSLVNHLREDEAVDEYSPAFLEAIAAIGEAEGVATKGE